MLYGNEIKTLLSWNYSDFCLVDHLAGDTENIRKRNKPYMDCLLEDHVEEKTQMNRGLGAIFQPAVREEIFAGDSRPLQRKLC